MYGGPNPKDINLTFSDHTYDKVVCLLNGETKSIMQDRYLRKFGSSKDDYLSRFPGAPLLSCGYSDAIRAHASSDKGRKSRSNNMTRLNLHDTDFKKKRNKATQEFRDSDRSLDYRAALSEKAKLQHKNGLEDSVRDYYTNRFPGSQHQKEQSKRMRENNPGARPDVIEKSKATYIANHNHGYHATTKNKFKDYDLQYQSSYEHKFLLYCEEKGIIDHISRSPTFKDADYPRRYYLPDYILYGEYVVEIKSWYIEKKQEELRPGITAEKSSLIIRSGYKWLYIVDFDYTELDQIIEAQK